MMATKDQERAALAKIRKIVEGLGEDSYIGMAFEGCFDDAEYNIENDFANSMKSRYERCLKEALDNEDEAKKERSRAEAAKKELELAKETLKAEADRASRLVESLEAEREKKDEWNRLYNERAMENTKLSGRIEELELENMKLKAKLYDMMVGA